MNWLVIDEEYLNYLRKTERRIPISNYGKDKYKPFFGILFETTEFYYVTQVSHAQKRHIKMKNNKDFKKIYNPKDNTLLAVINLNYMFPIPKNMKVLLKYKDIEQHRSFENNFQKSKYINLMKMELKQINKMNLESDGIFIYKNKYSILDKQLADRCIDFKQMEELARQYIKNKNSEELSA